MENFSYYNPTNIIFGKGCVKSNLDSLLAENNVKKMLIITGSGSIKRNGVYDDIISSLKNTNIEVFEYFGIEPNPTTNNINDCVKIIKENDIDFLLSAGGGSSLDATKAISRAAKIDCDIWDVFENKVSPNGDHVKFGCIITIPATSSEANAGAVITNSQTKQKRPMNFVHPTFSLCDPVYTYSLPVFQTGAGASDIVSHLFEQYFSLDQSLITQEFIFGILRVLKQSVPKVLVDETNYDLRSEIMYAGTMSLSYLFNNGQGAFGWDVHGIEHSLSGFYNITHGAGLAVLTPYWLDAIKSDDRASELILKLGKNVFNTSDVNTTIKEIRNMFNSFGMPSKLSDLGVDDTLLETCSLDVINAWGDEFGVFKKWKAEDVLALYKQAL